MKLPVAAAAATASAMHARLKATLNGPRNRLPTRSTSQPNAGCVVPARTWNRPTARPIWAAVRSSGPLRKASSTGPMLLKMSIPR